MWILLNLGYEDEAVCACCAASFYRRALTFKNKVVSGLRNLQETAHNEHRYSVFARQAASRHTADGYLLAAQYASANAVGR